MSTLVSAHPYVSISAAALAMMLGCAGGGGSGADETTAVITVAAGGTVSLEGSVLAVPAAALAEDTEVSMRLHPIAELAPLAEAHDQVLTIEPEGLTFAVPSLLTLALGGAVEADETAEVYRFVDGGWQALASTVISNGAVEVSVTGLGSYALIRREPSEGSGLSGTLWWGPDYPAADVPVQLYQGDTRLTEVTTDEMGGFAFVDVAPGDYRIVIDFECQLDEPVTVTAGHATEVDLTLCGG